MSGEADLVQQQDSKIFPRVTICEVTMREIGTDHMYSLQCILTFNLFNERIYAFIWFWIFFIVIPFTFVDLCFWLFQAFVIPSRYCYHFVKTRLRIFSSIETRREKFLAKLFTKHYMGMDGVFILNLIETNSNAAIVADLVSQMWQQFKRDQKEI